MTVVSFGPMPPPYNGQALITAKIVQLLAEGNTIIHFDTSGKSSKKGVIYHFRKIKGVLAGLHYLAFSKETINIVYTSLDSGWGMVYNWAILYVCRKRRFPFIIHHHSFLYIDRRSRLMSKISKYGGVHIFLCLTMKRLFEDQYQLPTNSLILSNAGLIDIAPLSPSTFASHSKPSTLTVGMLSNLTRQKGLYIFLDSIEAAYRSDLAFRAVLAGPCADRSDRKAIERFTRKYSEWFTYLGPVYDEAKQSFFLNLDIFAFPTLDPNEAQPCVAFEAMALGCVVIANARGCIASDLATPSNVIVEAPERFSSSFVQLLEHYLRHTELLRRAQRKNFEELCLEIDEKKQKLSFMEFVKNLQRLF